jgi:hypothetical protein
VLRHVLRTQMGAYDRELLVLATLVSSTLCHVILLSLDSEERLTARGRDPELLIQTLRPRARLRP